MFDPGLAPIPRRSLHDDVAERLREAIGEGRLPPGSVVPEVALAAEFGVSRTPIREALKVLAAEGLVEMMPKRGAVVARLSPRDVRDMTAVLARLEGLAGELACAGTDRDVAEDVALLHARMERAHAAGDRRTYFRLNLKIHERILAAADNPHLTATWRSYTGRLRRIRFLSNMTAADWQRSMAEHEAILAALEARDGALLARLLESHVAATWPTVAVAVGELAATCGDRDQRKVAG
jgi:DNA-binding GntR family transcriptional regulator